MMFGRVLQTSSFQKAWLSASAALGVLGMLAGIFELTRGHTSGIPGILGGLMLTAIFLIGLRRVGISRRH
jgi:hypothetical protein